MLTRLDELDRSLLEAVPGQECEMKVWLAERGAVVSALVEANPDAETTQELSARTQRIEQKLLHWRRSTLMEMSLIDQSLRFLEAQDAPIEVRGPLVDCRG